MYSVPEIVAGSATPKLYAEPVAPLPSTIELIVSIAAAVPVVVPFTLPTFATVS